MVAVDSRAAIASVRAAFAYGFLEIGFLAVTAFTNSLLFVVIAFFLTFALLTGGHLDYQCRCCSLLYSSPFLYLSLKMSRVSFCQDNIINNLSL